MGFLDRLLGREEEPQYNAQPQRRESAPQRTDDEIAIERYRYLLRTAPPETIEQVHAEAFAKLTPEQRQQVYDELKNGSEAPAGNDPDSLARAATRAEIRNPGTMERTFGGNNANAGRGGPSFGSMVGSSLLGTVAGYVIGSALVGAFMPDAGGNEAGGEGGGEGEANADGASDSGDTGGDAGGDAGGGDFGDGGGGGWGDGGFGGGDFGGGDFGGFDV